MSTLTETRVPTSEELVARVHAIGDLLRANSAQGDADRRVVESSIDALTGAGLFRLGTPRRYGGYEASMKTMLDVTSAVAECDGGTAWAVSLINVCNWAAGLFSIQAQDDVWRENPDARVSGVFAPVGTSVKVEGGYRISGRWYYNSGSWHADWAMLGFPRTDAEGNVVDYGFALIPRTDLTLEDTWFVVGMRASGSNCVIAEDVFVPEHRVLSAPEASEGRVLNPYVDQEPTYRSAFMPMLQLILIGPQLGMARRALELVTAQAGSRAVSGTLYQRQADSVAFQMRLAKASLMIDTAHLHAYRAAEDIDRAAREGVYPDFTARARIIADTGLVAEHAREAIDSLLTAYGAGSFAESSPMQRLWRDAAVAGRHAFVTPDARYETYGKALLEVEERIVALV